LWSSTVITLLLPSALLRFWLVRTRNRKRPVPAKARSICQMPLLSVLTLAVRISLPLASTR
jgi:hypothetical protein